LGSYWRSAAAPHEIGGEFALSDIYDCLLGAPPDLGWSGSSDRELQFLSELRVIDGTPRSGVGTFGAIRVQPNVDPLEIWYYDPELGPPESPVPYLRMDVTYCQYLAAVVLAKGTFGWQYLFAKVALRGPWFERRVAVLQGMLRKFPELFPDYDYGPLRARLEERL
jgi:hypothetical protein